MTWESWVIPITVICLDHPWYSGNYGYTMLYASYVYIYIHTVFCWGEKEPKSAKGDFHIAMTNGPCVDDINDVPICPYLKSSWVPVRTQFWILLGAISLILSHIPYHSMSYPNFWYGWRAGYIIYIYTYIYQWPISEICVISPHRKTSIGSVECPRAAGRLPHLKRSLENPPFFIRNTSLG